MPARKRIKLMTNSSEIANELSWKCPKYHLHQALVGERARKAALYPEGLCEAICRGLKREIRRSKMNVKVLTTVISTDKIGTDTSKNRSTAHEENGRSVGIASGMAWDDLTGATLGPREVSKAKLKELRYINDKSVYKKISRSEAVSKGICILKNELDQKSGAPQLQIQVCGRGVQHSQNGWLSCFHTATGSTETFGVGCRNSGLDGT